MRFLFWWLATYVAFILVRLVGGLELDAKALVGGLLIQLLLVAGVFAVVKRIRDKRAGERLR